MNKWISGVMGFLRPQFGGDSGGGGASAAQDRLLNTQADIAQGVYNTIYQPHAGRTVGYLGGMVDDANSGELERKAREQAGADAGMAMGQSNDAMARQIARYGINPARMASDSNTLALGTAANKVNAMNQAGRWAENQKWGRTYDFYNALSGVPSQTTSALGSAASGFGSMANTQANADAAGAAGWGRAGGMLGRSLFARDGGRVSVSGGTAALIAQRGVRLNRGGRVKADGGVCMAAGGLVQMPDWRTRPTTINSASGNPMAQFAGSTAMGAGQQLIKGAGKPALEAIKTGVKGMFGAPDAGALGALGGTAPEGLAAADAAAGLIPAVEGGMVAEGAAAAGAAAAEGAAAGGLSAVGTALPWVGAGLLVAKGLGLFKDGGRVRAHQVAAQGIRRKDMRRGGKVSGPGGPTDDKVPAWLSDEEHVVNAEAAKIIGHDTLDALNAEGLRRRGEADGSYVDENGVMHAAGGGNYLGIALGAATDEINRQKHQERADAELEMRQKSAAQEQAMRGIQIKQAQQAQADDDTFRTDLGGVAEGVKKIRAGDLSPATAFIEKSYNTQSGPFNDGATATYQQAPGGGMIINRMDASGKPIGGPLTLSNQQVVDHYVKGNMMDMAFRSPAQFKSWVAGNAAAAEKAADRASHEKIGAGKNAATLGAAWINQGAADRRHADNLGLRREDLGIRRERLDIDRERGGVTLQQQRQNAEIDTAREALSGLTPEEIKRRIAKSTDTGRENKEFDPLLERAARNASRRKIGTDDYFDSRQGQQPAAGKKTPKQAALEALAADPDMAGFTLGDQTFKGFKVLDKNGKHVGYFGR